MLTTLPESKIVSVNRPGPQKETIRLPTIHFQGAKLF